MSKYVKLLSVCFIVAVMCGPLLAADALCHVSDIAMRLKRKLRWDAKKEKFVNDEAANRRLRRSMRSPWKL